MDQWKTQFQWKTQLWVATALVTLWGNINHAQVFISSSELPSVSQLNRYQLDGTPSASTPTASQILSLTNLGSRILGSTVEGIFEFDLSGNLVGNFATVTGRGTLESDSAGNVYKSTPGGAYSTPTSFRLDSAGNITQTYSAPGLNSIDVIDAKSDGTTYIVNNFPDDSAARLFVFDAEGVYLNDFDVFQVGVANDLAINESLNELYLAGPRALSVYDISSSTPSFVETIDLPTQVTGVYVDQDTNRIFASTFETDSGGGVEISRDGTILNTYPFIGQSTPNFSNDIVAIVPEPASHSLLVLAVLMMATVKRRGRSL